MMVTREGLVDESVEESKDRPGRIALLALAAATALLLITVAVLGWLLYDKYHSAAQRGTNLAEQIRVACSDPDRVAELGSLCERADKVVEQAPVAPQKGDKGDPGPQGNAGPPPSSEQVAEAVRLYCSTGACRGIVSDSQVRQAVRLYCSLRKSCSGPAGETGATGAQGPQGPQGPAGNDGKDGTNGTDGQDASPFTFSFTVDAAIPGQATTYTCVVQDPATPATCTEG